MFWSTSDWRVRPLTLTAGIVVILASGSACNTRDRPDFGVGGGPDQIGPSTSIDSPTADTTVQQGPALQVAGRSLDADGIDTLYFVTEGGVTAFAPVVNAGTTFRFGLPITTNNLAGSVITVRVFGTDALGNRGDTATRVITVVP